MDLSLTLPINSLKLSEIIIQKIKSRNKQPRDLKILLIIDDHTRITPVRNILPHLFVYLNDCGILPKNITILIAGGSHRLMTNQEIIQKLGEDITESFLVLQHDWADEGSMINMGKTNLGFDVFVNSILPKSDVIIGIGNIIPHEIVGFSGGSKIIIPGVSTLKTVEKIHWMSTSIPINERLGNLNCIIREQINQAGKLAGLDYIINTVMDVNRRVVGIYSGDPVEAHKQGCLFAKEIFSANAEPTDIVITDCYPEETDFWTSAKAILHSKEFVNKNGIMIVCAACPEGISKTHNQILEMGYRSPQELESKFLSQKEGDQPKYNRLTATHCANLWEIQQHCDVYLVTTGIKTQECEFLNMKYFNNLQEALNEAISQFPNSKRINLIRHGSQIMKK
jgi:nickel-dependent lactate racemase